jgi:hypothetical protein
MTAIIEVLMEVGSLGYVYLGKSCGWSQTRRKVIRVSAERWVRGGGTCAIVIVDCRLVIVTVVLKGVRGNVSSTGICLACDA